MGNMCNIIHKIVCPDPEDDYNEDHTNLTNLNSNENLIRDKKAVRVKHFETIRYQIF